MFLAAVLFATAFADPAAALRACPGSQREKSPSGEEARAAGARESERPGDWSRPQPAEPVAGASAGPERTAATKGKAVIAGKSFELHHAWIIRGPDHFEEGQLNTYIVMAKDDISAELQKCPDVNCAIWDVLKNGLIMTPEKDGGFWVRAVHPQLAKEQQLSGRGWTATVDEPDHIVGRLNWKPQGKDPPILDLEIDAALLKAFPLPAPK